MSANRDAPEVHAQAEIIHRSINQWRRAQELLQPFNQLLPCLHQNVVR